MDIKSKTAEIVRILAENYPATCSLDTAQPHEVLFSTRLAAQCTDARVNEVTKVLYVRYPTIDAFAEADYADVCEIIKSCGLYKTKAMDLIKASVMLRDEFGGKVPDTMEELLRLPGIGRKTANLVLSDVFGKPAVVTDTHCIRISNRLGLVDTKDPYKVELALAELIEPEDQAPTCHRFVHFGRDICTARSPRCGECPLKELCPSNTAQ